MYVATSSVFFFSQYLKLVILHIKEITGYINMKITITVITLSFSNKSKTLNMILSKVYKYNIN